MSSATRSSAFFASAISASSLAITSEATRSGSDCAAALPRRRAHLHLLPHLAPRLGIDALARRLAHRHEHDLIEPELERSLLGEHEVPDVRRVERASENADRGDLALLATASRDQAR